MKFIERMHQLAKQNPKRLVLPEGTEARTIQAARILVDEKLAASVTLLGNREAIEQAAAGAKTGLQGIAIVDPESAPEAQKYANEFYQLRKAKGMTPEVAARSMKNPLFWGAMMVNLGAVDSMVAGAENSTANVLRPSLTIIRTREGMKVASSCFVMYLPGSKWGVDGHMIFSDCATVPDPDSDQLAEIAISAADSCQTFLQVEPIVALLSFSTKGSATHPAVDKVVRAVEIVRRRRPELLVDGEMQADAALIPSVAEKKAPGSKVAGRANVIVFPDLNSGNIGYKLVQRMAKAEAYGPFLQGFRKPVSDLSRGCSVSDIVNTSSVVLVQAQSSR